MLFVRVVACVYFLLMHLVGRVSLYIGLHMSFGNCVLNFIFFMCSLVVTMGPTTTEFSVKPSIIRGSHGPHHSYMVTMGRRPFLSLRYDHFPMCHFGQFLLVVNLVM